MITIEDMDKLMSVGAEIFIEHENVDAWLDANGIEPEAFITVSIRLAAALREGLLRAAVEDMLSGDEVEAEETVMRAVAAAMGVAFIVGWMCHQKLAEP